MPQKKPRFYILDLVRGLAVILMILAHAVYFFHIGDSELLLGLEKMGNIFCFTTFLLVSGATTYAAYLTDNSFQQHKKRILSKILIILLSYFFIAIFVEIKEISQAVGLDKFKLIFNIILFRTLPSYTEYIVPFIFYPLLVLIWQRYFFNISKSFIKTVLLSAGLYLIGYLIFLVPVADWFVPTKALFSGGGNLYRFPLLQYAPVFIFGLYWGRKLVTLPNLKAKKVFTINFAIACSLILASILFLGLKFGLNYDQLLRRWPPSISFLLIGLAVAFVIIYLFYALRRLNFVPIVRDFLLLMGQNAYSIFWAHIFLLTLYSMFGGVKVSSPLIFLFMFALLIVGVITIAMILPFNFKLALTFLKRSREDEEELLDKSTLVKFEEELSDSGYRDFRYFIHYFFPKKDASLRDKRLIRKRHALFIIISAIVVAVLVSPVILEETQSYIRSKQKAYWWDDSFQYRQNVTVINQSAFSNIGEGQILTLTLNHKELVQNKQAKADGSDFKIVYLTHDQYEVIPFNVTNDWNSKDTSLEFAVSATILGGKEDGYYYLYFGNAIAESDLDKINGSKTEAEYKITYGRIETQTLALSLDKRWHLIDDNQTGSAMDFSVVSAVDLGNQDITYSVVDTAISGKMTKTGNEYEGKIDLSSFLPGTYQLNILANKDGQVYRSTQSFFISYPLYVAWTQDWEGYDVNNDYLKAIAEISNRYDLPITHFFNPRIYVGNNMSDERRNYITSWVKNRLSNGDGFAMHLHMFYDLVEAAGVPVRTEPSWDNKNDGYGVLTTAYTKDELTKIITRGLQELEKQNFPRPEIYRAGGWYADENTLAALEELNFAADSSGRTSYKFGSNQLAGPWNLQATTQPYKPSVDDQNANSISNPINLLEIPNNGADSYWFSAKEMISRFDQNFQNNALTTSKQVTFLSHPHWFKKEEQAKIIELFNYVSQYEYRDDNGPVIYATSDQIYQEWIKK